MIGYCHCVYKQDIFGNVYNKGFKKTPSIKLFLRNFFQTLKVSLDVFLFEYREQRKVKKIFYKDLTFRNLDQSLRSVYRYRNPYRIAKKFWNADVYGETPLTSLEIIGIRASLLPSDRFIDLGSGRGRGVFFMRYRFGSTSIGIEKVPSFVHTASFLQKNKGIDGVEFIRADLKIWNKSLDVLLSTKSVFYLAWSCFDEALISSLEEKLEECAVFSKIVTISCPIESVKLKVVDTFSVPFVWGDAEVFIHERLL